MRNRTRACILPRNSFDDVDVDCQSPTGSSHGLWWSLCGWSCVVQRGLLGFAEPIAGHQAGLYSEKDNYIFPFLIRQKLRRRHNGQSCPKEGPLTAHAVAGLRRELLRRRRTDVVSKADSVLTLFNSLPHCKVQPSQES